VTIPPPTGFVNTGAWSIAELTAGIVTAALGTIRLLFSRHFPALPTEVTEQKSQSASSLRKTTDSKHLGSMKRHPESELELVEGVNSSRNRSDRSGSQTGQPQQKRREDAPGGVFGFASRGNRGWVDISEPTSPATLRFGARTRVTAGKHDRSMSAGAAEFLGDYGIRVETAWEVEEVIIERS
jgi:hypothetical protein